jgi:hypothetical protein
MVFPYFPRFPMDFPMFSHPMGPPRFFTCTVGRKPSAAKFFLDDTDEVPVVTRGHGEVPERSYLVKMNGNKNEKPLIIN